MTLPEELTYDPRTVVDHWTVDILHRIHERPFRDVPNPELAPGVLHELLKHVGNVAAGEENPSQDWAVDLLHGIWEHVCTGTPFGEPKDPEYEMFLSPGPGGGDWG